ncbi:MULTISPECIES: ATP/GTP-binding protein [unclassified Campylobacter]|uniref:ATP/GTP-binding protein n=1 Tax=unclassified Campylobacter TaxID=2593542 RepID=UPI003D32C264
MRADFNSQTKLSSLDFSFKTSSGDKINLGLYNNKSVEYASARTANSSIQSLTLTHEYGYNFEYVGNGIDANDLKEINEALEKIQPKIDEFLKQIEDDKIFSNSEITNLASSLKSELPQAKDLNHANLIADKTLKMFDSLLEQHKLSQKMLEKVNKLFENVIDNTQKFSFYV